jgi:cyclophilin family peptidyl-prolyl cis-trans isomerase
MPAADEISVIKCGTTTGPIVMEMHREWSPNGYDKAVALFEKGYYDHTHFFRVVPKFLVQFGITYSESQELKQFGRQTILDDPQLDPIIPFEPGTISFAGSGPDSRSSQLFISYSHSTSLGTNLWETPVGKVIDGMDHVNAFYSYGDMPPWGKGPVQGKIHAGRSYIDENFPLTDKFVTCSVERSGKAKKEVVKEKKAYENDWEVKRSEEDRESTGLRKLGNPMHKIVNKAKEFDETALICGGVAISLLLILICGIGGNKKTGLKKAS